MLAKLAKAEAAAAVLLLASVTGLVFVAAVMRSFNHPINWSIDMAKLLFAWLCMLGANRALRQQTHVGMEVMVKYLPHRRKLWLETACAALIILFLLVLTWHGFKLTWQNRQRIFGDSTLSYAFVTASVPVGCLLFIGTLTGLIGRAWRAKDGDLLIYTRTQPADPELSQAEI